MLSKWKKRVRELLADKGGRGKKVETLAVPGSWRGTLTLRSIMSPPGACFTPHFLKDLGMMRNVDKQQKRKLKLHALDTGDGPHCFHM